MTAVRVLKPADLQPHHFSAWRGCILDNPQLASPFFSPEYSLAVARVISNVYIGVQEEDDESVAFLPFELSSNGIGTRLRLCDLQGIVSLPGKISGVREFIQKCGLRAWDFDHLIADQAAFTLFHRNLEVSNCMDLSEGFDAYLAERNASGTKLIKKTRNLEKRLEREHGSLRFEMHVAEPSVLNRLLEWRTAKYPGSRHQPEIVSNILNQLLLEQSPDCQGTLSVLYVNEKIAACHFGLRSKTVWHYWFPAYNPCYEMYSPGNILLLRMAEAAPPLGITTIDLGKGEQDYKKRFANKTVPIAEGYVSTSPWLSFAREIENEARRRLHPSSFLGALARRIRNVRGVS